MIKIAEIVKNIGVQEVSRRLGIDQSSVWRHSKGGRMSAWAVLRYHTVFGIPLESLEGQIAPKPKKVSSTG